MMMETTFLHTVFWVSSKNKVCAGMPVYNVYTLSEFFSLVTFLVLFMVI